jgi:hypothetical protein
MLSRRSLLTSHAGSESIALVRRVGGAAGAVFERMDAFARRWTTASLLLLTLAGLFAGLMLQAATK